MLPVRSRSRCFTCKSCSLVARMRARPILTFYISVQAQSRRGGRAKRGRRRSDCVLSMLVDILKMLDFSLLCMHMGDPHENLGRFAWQTGILGRFAWQGLRSKFCMAIRSLHNGLVYQRRICCKGRGSLGRGKASFSSISTRSRTT